jgi:hypothetical protein
MVVGVWLETFDDSGSFPVVFPACLLVTSGFSVPHGRPC